MNDNLKRCIRCDGQKNIYKIGGAYSKKDTGGIEVECPLCQGEGWTKPLAEMVKDITKKKPKKSKQ